ncbi:MAG TPA: hypothetical protein VIF64_04155 [Pyrinomonadaceae bacterium]|jgi:hypothetical protein
MKQANNNEIDLLLRALAKGRGASAFGSNSGDGNRAASDHLDADELNSYAEGLVPAPARARYTEHLADCDMCRGIIANLTQAAGIATHAEVPEQKSRPTLWQKLASLLSPPVLRFAVPALVLTAVFGIGLLTMRQHPFSRRSDVARVEAPSEPAKVEPLQTETSTGSPTLQDSITPQKKGPSPEANDVNKREQYFQDNQGRVGQEEASRTGAVAGTLASKDAGQAGEAGNRAELKPGYAPEPKAAAPAPATSTYTEADKTTQLAKEQRAKLDDQESQRDAYKNAPTPSDEHGPNRSVAPRSSTVPLNSRRLDGLVTDRGGPSSAAKKGKVDEKANEKAEMETRTISGKRFVRDDNAWVDTAFDHSRTPIRVARGSEQFRALVADEPGLRAIAEQLNGVVIVVWKNRAYRIQ